MIGQSLSSSSTREDEEEPRVCRCVLQLMRKGEDDDEPQLVVVFSFFSLATKHDDELKAHRLLIMTQNKSLIKTQNKSETTS